MRLPFLLIALLAIHVHSATIPETSIDEEYKITDLLYLDIHQADKGSDKSASHPLGTIIIGLFGEVVPKTVRNFKELAPTYENTKTLFHRVIPDFVIQAGDIDNMGGHSIYGEKGAPPPSDATNEKDFGPFFSGLVDENFILTHNKKGRVSVANAGPNTGGSQFFICMEPASFLDGKHVVFGQVLKGFDVAELIVNVKRDGSDKPFDDVFINAAYGTKFSDVKQLELNAITARENGVPEESNEKTITEISAGDDSLKIHIPSHEANVLQEDQMNAYQKQHPSGLGGSSHHFVLLPFALIVGLVGFLSYKNRRTISSMIRGPRYRRIQSVS